MLVSCLVLAGCVDGFEGAAVQIDLSPFTPAQASEGQAPDATELPAQTYFTLWRVDDAPGGMQTFGELQRFEVHRVVDPDSPCFIDVGEQVPYEGLHITQFAAKVAEVTGITDLANPPADATENERIDAATSVQRMANVMALATAPAGVKVVTTASVTQYPAVDADCTGAGLPPPTCMDSGSNARRLRVCREVWAADPLKFEGTDRVLTAPLSGTTFGFVVGMNPINQSPVGGAQFLTLDTLADPAPDAYAVTIDADGAATPGTVFLFGTPVPTATRGVTHVRMGSPVNPMAGAVLAVFANLGEDEVDF